MSEQNFEKVLSEIKEQYTREYIDIVKAGVYRDPRNYYLVCVYPWKGRDLCQENEELRARIREGLRETLEKNKVALYFHVPFCVKRCSFCNFTIINEENVTNRKKVNDMHNRYVGALLKELQIFLNTIAPSRFDVHSIYIGGGTPTALETEVLERLLVGIKQIVGFSEVEEWTVEASPGTVSEEKLDVMLRNGVTRISLGVQTFDDDTLEMLRRDHNSDQARRAIQMILERRFNLNIDLIPGLPIERGRERKFLFHRLYRDIETAISLKVPSVTFYHLWTRGMDNTEMYRKIQDYEWILPSRHEVVMEWMLINRQMKEGGYYQNPAGWFVLENAEFKQQLFKWSSTHNYIGFGLSAYTYFCHCSPRAERRGGGKIVNDSSWNRYLEMVNRGQLPWKFCTIITPSEADHLHAVFSVKTERGLHREDVAYPEQFNKVISALEILGLVTVKRDGEGNWESVQLSEKGWIMFDEVSEAFASPEQYEAIKGVVDWDKVVETYISEQIAAEAQKQIDEWKQNLRQASSNKVVEVYNRLPQKIQGAFKNVLANIDVLKVFEHMIFGYNYGGEKVQNVFIVYRVGRAELILPYIHHVHDTYQKVIQPWFLEKFRRGETLSLTHLLLPSPDETSEEWAYHSVRFAEVSQVYHWFNQVLAEYLQNKGYQKSESPYVNFQKMKGIDMEDIYKEICRELHNGNREPLRRLWRRIIEETTESRELQESDFIRILPSLLAFFSLANSLDSELWFIPSLSLGGMSRAAVFLEVTGARIASKTFVPEHIEHNLHNLVSPLNLLEWKMRDELNHMLQLIHKTRIAMTTIMSRNLSHNIGSHVLSRLSFGEYLRIPELEDLLRKLQGVLKQKQQQKPCPVSENDIEKIQAKYRGQQKGLRNTFRYLQIRQDFLAQIASEWFSWAESASMLRHLMREFLVQEILLDHIAGAEGLKAWRYNKDRNS